MKNFGKEIWEKKMNEQGIGGVIGGTYLNSNSKLKEREIEAMKRIKKEVLPLMSGKDIIDIGTGSGKFLIELSRLGYKCDGLDIGSNIIDYAKKMVEEANIDTELFCMDITKDYPRKKYDMVFCYGTFGHFPSYASLRVIEHFKNMIKESGIIYIHLWKPVELNLPNITTDFIYNFLRILKQKIKGKSYHTNNSRYSVDDIKEMANLSDLKIIKIKGIETEYHVILKKK
ncbi:MAG: class I SAM-dependent methyltransferase [archaeon]